LRDGGALVARLARMKLATVPALALTCLLVTCGTPLPSEPAAPAEPEEIIAYHDSGAWHRDTSTVLNRAKAALERHLVIRPQRPAIVLDIDDTSLSTYECLKQFDFDRQAAGSSCASSGRLPAIPQTVDLYRLAREHGVAVHFVTGRRQGLRRPTARNLRAAGYSGPLRLIMRPDGERSPVKDGYKSRTRQDIERRGYVILINVGDQRSDLDGGSAREAFKLPNPMYVTQSS